MRKSVITLSLTAALACTGTMSAGNAEVMPMQETMSSGQDFFDLGATVTTGPEIPIAPACEAFPEDFTAAETAQAARPRNNTAKSISSVAQITGDRIMTWSGLTSSYNSGGCAVTVSQIEGTDSVLISNFWYSYEVKAIVDLTESKLYIPNQVIGTNSTYGDFDIAYCTTSALNRSRYIEGDIADDGTVTFSTSWGVFYTSGNSARGLYTSTVIEPGNATMTQVYYSTTSGDSASVSYPVLVTQTDKRRVTVRNFANYGHDIEIVLRADSTATIDYQLAYESSLGYFYTCATTYTSSMGIESASYVIYCNAATDSRTISWNEWSLYSPSGYMIGLNFTGTIETTFDLSYPAISTATFDGDGTEASPYLIKTTDDWLALADEVNYSVDYSYGSDGDIAIPYRGKYFRLENDLDMTDVDLDPIGFDGYQRFGGIFDGNNHTISNATIETGYRGYAALFGRTDTACVIKNLYVTNITASSNLYYVGGIAGWSYGTIDNCHVTGATLTATENYGAAGIAASGRIITNCSVTATAITALGGYGGGIAGQILDSIGGCSAVDVDITASGLSTTGYPSGGITGYLYYATATDCYFTGTVDGTTDSSTGEYLGGIAGYSYRSSIERCFASGYIAEAAYNGRIGGIVGYAVGTITNCCFTGRVEDAKSEYVGGIAGYAGVLSSYGVKTQVEISGCYVAAQITSDTEDYDTSTGCREIIGVIPSTASPTITNTYFDSQISTLGTASYAATTSALTAAAGPEGFDSSVWTFSEGVYPRLTAFADTEAAKFAASALVMDEASSLDKLMTDASINLLGATTAYFLIDGAATTTGYYSTIADGKLKIGSDIGSDTLYFASDGIGTNRYIIKISSIPFDGDGTEQSPFLIKTKSDLITLAEATTNSGQLFTGNYFLMTNDIDLENDENFVGICANLDDDSSNLFAGTFDGGGYTIHNMTLPSAVYWSSQPTTGYGSISSSKSVPYKGFIGALAASGTLKNLTIAADCTIDELWSYSGALVGYNYGTVDSCRNYADVTGYGQGIGGIVGRNAADASVTNCYNEGNIRCGYRYGGGIVGYHYFAVMQNCQNAGDVTVTQLSNYKTTSSTTTAGGVAATMCDAVIENCVNSGTVTGYTCVGGIVGMSSTVAGSKSNYDNTVNCCVNYGSIVSSTPTYTGMVSGNSSKKDMASNYYDAQIATYGACGNADYDGVTGATTAVLTSGTALDGFTASAWSFVQGSYPVLAQFAADTKSAIARNIIISIADGETVSTLLTSPALSSADDCVWTLKDGTAFSIADGKLIVPDALTDTVCDTLYATAGAIVKPLAIQSLPHESGISTVPDDCRTLVDEAFYTPAGTLATKPSGSNQPRAIYIVRRTYSDGTVEVAKEAR